MAGSGTTTIRPDGHRQPQLDGLRAYAVVAVILGHLGFPYAAGGGIGVELFFVLSGFLITHLLLREYDRRGSIDVIAFYRRRAWRLLPALVLMLVLVDLFTWLEPWGEPEHGLLHANLIGSLWVLGFVANWTHEWIGSYIHLWSLSIEEQFYIFWAPIMVLLAPRVDRGVAARVALALAVLSILFREILATEGVSFHTLYNSTYSHVYGLLIGASLALGLTRDGVIRIPGWTVWLRRLSLPALAVLTAVVTLSPFILTNVEYQVLYLPLTVAAPAVLVGAVVVGGSRWTRVLALSPVVWVGRISYSLYLWHLPVYVAFEETGWARDHLFMSGVLKLAISFGLAAASYHFVEQPLLRRFAARDSTAAKGRRFPRQLLPG